MPSNETFTGPKPTVGPGDWDVVTGGNPGKKFDDGLFDHLHSDPKEERVVNADTGGEKGSKLERFDLIPTAPLAEVARHYGRGASKYEDRNWERGYKWSLSYAALQRHANAFWGGETFDPETGSHHLAAVVFHALAMMEWGRTHPELDDRPHGNK